MKRVMIVILAVLAIVVMSQTPAFAAKYKYTLGVGERIKCSKKLVQPLDKSTTKTDIVEVTSFDASSEASADASANSSYNASSEAPKNNSESTKKRKVKKLVVSIKGKYIIGMRPGTATVRCKDGSKFKVKVKAAPKKVSIKVAKNYIFASEVTKVKAAVNKKSICNKFKFTSSNKTVATVNSKGVVKGKKKGSAIIKVKIYNGKTASVKVNVKSKDKLICLTFDDGPGSDTPRLISALKSYNYHATFFMVGVYVQGHKNLLNTMVNDGHELGMHSWRHDDLSKLTTEQVVADIDKTSNLIKSYTGVKPNGMRPPYGSVDSEVLNAFNIRGLPCILWNSNIKDYETTSSAVVTSNILKVARPGVVLVVHDSHSWSVTGLINALPTLKKHGYECVSVEEFVRLKNKKLAPGKQFMG